MDKTRTIIIDGIEIQTSLTGVEIAGLVQRNKELEQQVKKQKEVIDKAVEYINQHWVIDDPVCFKNDLLQILEDKEVSE